MHAYFRKSHKDKSYNNFKYVKKFEYDSIWSCFDRFSVKPWFTSISASLESISQKFTRISNNTHDFTHRRDQDYLHRVAQSAQKINLTASSTANFSKLRRLIPQAYDHPSGPSLVILDFEMRRWTKITLPKKEKRLKKKKKERKNPRWWKDLSNVRGKKGRA